MMVTHVWTDGAAPTHSPSGIPGGGNWWGEGDRRTKGFTVLGDNDPLVAGVGAVMQALKDIFKSSPGDYCIHTDHTGIVDLLDEIQEGEYEYDLSTDSDDLIWSEQVYFKLYKVFRCCPRTHTIDIEWTNKKVAKMKHAHFIARQALQPESRDHTRYLSYYSNKKKNTPNLQV